MSRTRGLGRLSFASDRQIAQHRRHKSESTLHNDQVTHHWFSFDDIRESLPDKLRTDPDRAKYQCGDRESRQQGFDDVACHADVEWASTYRRDTSTPKLPQVSKSHDWEGGYSCALPPQSLLPMGLIPVAEHLRDPSLPFGIFEDEDSYYRKGSDSNMSQPIQNPETSSPRVDISTSVSPKYPAREPENPMLQDQSRHFASSDTLVTASILPQRDKDKSETAGCLDDPLKACSDDQAIVAEDTNRAAESSEPLQQLSRQGNARTPQLVDSRPLTTKPNALRNAQLDHDTAALDRTKDLKQPFSAEQISSLAKAIELRAKVSAFLQSLPAQADTVQSHIRASCTQQRHTNSQISDISYGCAADETTQDLGRNDQACPLQTATSVENLRPVTRRGSSSGSDGTSHTRTAEFDTGLQRNDEQAQKYIELRLPNISTCFLASDATLANVDQPLYQTETSAQSIRHGLPSPSPGESATQSIRNTSHNAEPSSYSAAESADMASTDVMEQELRRLSVLLQRLRDDRQSNGYDAKCSYSDIEDNTLLESGSCFGTMSDNGLENNSPTDGEEHGQNETTSKVTGGDSSDPSLSGAPGKSVDGELKRNHDREEEGEDDERDSKRRKPPSQDDRPNDKSETWSNQLSIPCVVQGCNGRNSSQSVML
jgi:hypothetical protein